MYGSQELFVRLNHHPTWHESSYTRLTSQVTVTTTTTCHHETMSLTVRVLKSDCLKGTWRCHYLLHQSTPVTP